MSPVDGPAGGSPAAGVPSGPGDAGSPEDRSAPVREDGRANGFGRVLVAVYAVFAVSASARAGVQLATDLDTAPLAYSLSAFAAAVYVVATLAIAGSGPRSRRVAWVAVLVELVGVLGVGVFSLLVPELFPQATVWSELGRGYGYVPLVLPLVGVWWLHRTSPRRGAR